MSSLRGTEHATSFNFVMQRASHDSLLLYKKGKLLVGSLLAQRV